MAPPDSLTDVPNLPSFPSRATQAERIVGICVSGGGLRSAAFSLGALQVLQERRGLLRGPHAARYLSAVSGGSYTAGAYTLVNCSDRLAVQRETKTRGVPPDEPFAPGSPEAEHLRRHCRYLVEDGGLVTCTRLVLYGALNLLAIVSLVVWSGTMLGDLAFLTSQVEPSAIDSTSGLVWLQWLLAAALIVILAAGVARVYRGTNRHSWRGRLAWMAGVFALAPALAARVSDTPVLASPAWLLSRWTWIGSVLACLVVATSLLLWSGRRAGAGGAIRLFLGKLGFSFLTLRVLQVLFFLVAAWTIALFFPLYNEHSDLFLILFFAVLGLPLLLQRFVDRASPHHAYRDALMRCFGIFRTDAGNVAVDARIVQRRLSELEPRRNADGVTFPELLICAAANLSDIGATPAGSNVFSIVFSPSIVTIPAVPGASMRTEQFERFLRPAALRGWCPAVTLASAIAVTGAALSPAMGRKTRNNLRALFTALNIRLGIWIPNLLIGSGESRSAALGNSGEADSVIAALAGKNDPAFVMSRDIHVSVGLDELVRELFGYHSSKAPLLYVSDGGHYENLGLVELLRRQCSEIWCIDASGDRPGHASALAEAMRLADNDLGGVEIELELESFERADNSSGPFGSRLLRNTHAHGTVHYPDGEEGSIIVVKLGLTERSPDPLLDYQRGDRRFPHHPTLNQLYRAERFDAYRALGRASMSEALRDEAVLAQVGWPPDRDSEDAPLAAGK